MINPINIVQWDMFNHFQLPTVGMTDSYECVLLLLILTGAKDEFANI